MSEKADHFYPECIHYSIPYTSFQANLLDGVQTCPGALHHPWFYIHGQKTGEERIGVSATDISDIQGRRYFVV